MEGSDPELGLVYYLFSRHGILPGDYYSRTQGEKDLLWALSSYEPNKKAPPVPGGQDGEEHQTQKNKPPYLRAAEGALTRTRLHQG